MDERDRPLTADPESAEVAVTGTVIENQTTVIPSAADQNTSADRARGRTAVQVGIPAALVGIGSWAARLANLDLDPRAGVDLPADVAGYFVAVLTVALAWRMNPKSKG